MMKEDKQVRTFDKWCKDKYHSELSKDELIRVHRRTYNFFAWCILFLVVIAYGGMLGFAWHRSNYVNSHVTEDFAVDLASAVCELSGAGRYIAAIRHDAGIVVDCEFDRITVMHVEGVE